MKNMAVKVIDRLFIVAYGTASPTPGEWAGYLDLVAHHGVDRTAQLIWTAGGEPTPAQRNEAQRAARGPRGARRGRHRQRSGAPDDHGALLVQPPDPGLPPLGHVRRPCLPRDPQEPGTAHRARAPQAPGRGRRGRRAAAPAALARARVAAPRSSYHGPWGRLGARGRGDQILLPAAIKSFSPRRGEHHRRPQGQPRTVRPRWIMFAVGLSVRSVAYRPRSWRGDSIPPSGAVHPRRSYPPPTRSPHDAPPRPRS